MSKKVTYGKTFGVFYDAYRQFCRQNAAAGTLEDDSLEQFHQFFINNFVSQMDDATCVQLFVRDARKELTHIYIQDKTLLDFLMKMEVRDIEGLKDTIKEYGQEVIVNQDDYLENLTAGCNYAICLHIPEMSQGFVIAYTLYTTTGELRIFVNHGMEQYHISSNEISDKKSIVYTDPEINEITNLAINIIAYMSCFPECLRDGAPHGVKTENNHILHTDEKVTESIEKDSTGIINPHFRRGYFKRLTSDYYKNKKGQVIFVHETIVNEQAKTLENIN